MAALKLVHVVVRLTEAQAADIDAARGETARGPWIRDAALALARPGRTRREAGPEGCPPHPKRRVLRGLCGACGRNVGDEKTA